MGCSSVLITEGAMTLNLAGTLPGHGRVDDAASLAEATENAIAS